MDRRTKIVATMGPACDDPAVVRAMIRAGLDMARVSFSHGTLDEARSRIKRVRDAATAERKYVGVLGDLPGPKIRATSFTEGGVHLFDNDLIDLVPGSTVDASAADHIGVDYEGVLDVLQPGDRVALGDGAIELIVEEMGAGRATARILSGGWVQGRPGVTLPSGRLALESPTEHDLEILAQVANDLDAVAVSFVRTPDDVHRARRALGIGPGPILIAKIETQEAVDGIDEIIAVSDGVMVARGDLGIRCALEDVPHYQKRIIRTGVAYGRPVITATQMLESMIKAPKPTRAEVSDVANAVFDGTSALMLSAETAVGDDPVAAVATLARVAWRGEQEFDYVSWGRNLGRLQHAGTQHAPAQVRITAAVSAAAWRAAVDADVTAIIACTNTGSTARAISRFRPRMPVIAATPSDVTARRLSVAWGITPLVVDTHGTTDDVVWFSVEAAVNAGLVAKGELVAVLVGSPDRPESGTDTLRIVRIR